MTGTDIDFPTGPFTLSGWFQTGVVGPRKILSKYLSSTTQIYVMTLANGHVLAGLYDGNNWQEVSTTQSYVDNVWHHFALVVTTTTLELFIDGVSQGTGAHDNSFPVNNVVWNFGRSANNVQYFQGSLDEIKLYNKALTSAEVASDMNTPIAASSTPTSSNWLASVKLLFQPWKTPFLLTGRFRSSVRT